MISFASRQRIGDRRRDLRQHLDLPIAEVALATCLDRLIHLLDALRRRVGDPADADRFGVGCGLGLESHARRVGVRLRDLRGVELGDALQSRASWRFASACAISAAFDARVCSSSRCLSEIARSASSCASLARRD